MAEPMPGARRLASLRIASRRVLDTTGRFHPTHRPRAGQCADQNEVAAFVTAARRDTTEIMTAELGSARLRALRAQGAAMDETQACSYARAHVEQCLTQIAVGS
jgi:hypothetical protein